MNTKVGGLQVVWFKRDLRVADHMALLMASQHGAVLPLYVVEDDYWKQPDASGRHWNFIAECLADLKLELHALGRPLVVRRGCVTSVLENIHATYEIGALWSHVETGNNWTFQRDKAVAAFCKSNAITWHQRNQFGVFRALENRDEWSRRHGAFMQNPLASKPVFTADHLVFETAPIPSASELGLADDPCPLRQRGGRCEALRLLNSFFNGRGKNYSFRMSSPLSAAESCSRLSPHLSAGTVSIREVMQRTFEERQRASATPWPAVDVRAIDSFASRLHWHCHFIQKLESEPQIEWRSMHPAFEAARSKPENSEALLVAWETGQTGFPFVDACMRSLIASGWINFRMRAMLVSFATYHLALDWYDVGLRLAKLFTDYEPGIHWPQIQMQAGQTGINVPRIYNPVKQSLDQDPHGVFIKRWLPELAALPETQIHEPWRKTQAEQVMCGVRLGQNYPHPLVAHEDAARAAKLRLTNTRRSVAFRETAQAVFVKHGSRKRPARKPKTTKPVEVKQQLSFDL
jgi:deoxyribodipyrimidine photo-lyase